MSQKTGIDIDRISEIVSGGDARSKIEALEALECQLPEWDIFPVGMLLSGLSDPDPEVRIRIFSLLSYCSDHLTDQNALQVLQLLEHDSEEVRKLAVATIIAVFGCIDSFILREKIHCLWHKDEGVRATAMQLFSELSYQFTEEMFMSVAEAYNFQNIEVRESIAEFLERNGHGGLIEN